MLRNIYAYLIESDIHKLSTALVIRDSIDGYYPAQIRKRLQRDNNVYLTISGIKSTKNRHNIFIKQQQEDQK